MSNRQAVAIFGSSQIREGSAEWVAAETAGARCAERGLDVVTGGYGGVMEAASRGAVGAGGIAIGVTAPGLFPHRLGANTFITYEIKTTSLAERIGVLTDLAAGALVLPGSIGTAAELIIAWNLNQLSRGDGGKRLPTVAVGAGWREIHRLLTERLGAAEFDVHIVDTVTEAVDWLLDQPEIG